jgi:iron complex outermembrane receptor protein
LNGFEFSGDIIMRGKRLHATFRAASALALTMPVAALALAAPGAAAEPAAVQFRISAQAVQSALAAFSRQSGIQILFPYDQVAGLRAQSVNGRMTPEVALSRLIEGTGLKINRTSGDVIALSLAKRMPDGRKPVQVASLSVTSVPASLGMAMQSSTTIAEIAPQAREDTNAGEAIVVTGSRGQERTVMDSPTPIDVIGAAELEKTGKAGIFSALNTLVPSFNLPVRAGGATSTVIATGGLRGLNPDQTLILVNGKRRHKTSLINAVSTLYNGSVPADLDMIPTSAVDHIEVLRDGAAAQYGSDGIAGVINIILKKGTEGGSASFSAGQNFDRSDGELYRADANVGLALGERGFLNLSISAKKQEMSNRADPIAGCSVTATTTCLYPLVNGQLDPRDARDVGTDRILTTSYGVMPQQSINTAFNAAYEVGDVELYAFGTYGQRRSDLWYSYRYPKDVNNLMDVYPNGYRPHVRIDEEDLEIAVGARGEIKGWNWDFSNTYGRNRARQSSTGTLNPTLGNTSPTAFYIGALRSSEYVSSLDLTRGYDVGGGNLQVSAGGQFRREKYETFAGDPASYAVGPFTLVGTTPRTPGAQSSAGFQPDDVGKMSRDNFALYGDVAYDPSRNLTIGAAARFEHYDDASGDTLIWKLNSRYAVTPWLALRGAVSTGFRAPAVAQQIYSQTTNQFRTVLGVNNVLLQIKTLPVDSPTAIALGASPLTPEKSTNISGGIVLTPLRSLNITIDAYQIKVKDRIVITSTLTGSSVIPILIANGLSPALSAQYYTNAIDTRTRGVDVVATYRHTLFDDIKMQWNFGFNYNKTVITHIIDNPSQLSALSTELFDRSSRSNLTTNLPKTKAFLNNVTTIGDFSLNSRLVRFGKFDVLQNASSTVNGVPVYANDRHYSAKWITDLELGWQLTKTVDVAIGANNIFNVYPDAVGAVSATLGQGKYPGTSPIGFTGGFYYARLGIDF